MTSGRAHLSELRRRILEEDSKVKGFTTCGERKRRERRTERIIRLEHKPYTFLCVANYSPTLSTLPVCHSSCVICVSSLSSLHHLPLTVEGGIVRDWDRPPPGDRWGSIKSGFPGTRTGVHTTGVDHKARSASKKSCVSIILHPVYTLYTPLLPHMHLYAPVIHVYTPYIYTSNHL